MQHEAAGRDPQRESAGPRGPRRERAGRALPASLRAGTRSARLRARSLLTRHRRRNRLRPQKTRGPEGGRLPNGTREGTDTERRAGELSRSALCCGARSAPPRGDSRVGWGYREPAIGREVFRGTEMPTKTAFASRSVKTRRTAPPYIARAEALNVGLTKIVSGHLFRCRAGSSGPGVSSC